MPTEGVQLLALEKKKGCRMSHGVVLARYWWLAKILTRTKTEACLVLQKVDLMVAKCSCKCFLRLRPVFILRAETLSDPLWIKKKKKKNNSYCNWNENVRTRAVRGWKCRSEKGEVLSLSVGSQEAEMHRSELLAAQTGHGPETL